MRLISEKKLAAALAAALALAAGSAEAALTWNWSYSGMGISAGGMLITTDTANAGGFHEVLSISGNRNGVAITGLFPAGQPIPGNAPFPLDNLIRIAGPDQLTQHGLGFSLADGTYSNPFYATFNSPAGYLEVLTKGTSLISEPPITFSASPVPEPASLALVVSGLVAVGWSRRSKNIQPA